jgi:hypothetical protein
MIRLAVVSCGLAVGNKKGKKKRRNNICLRIVFLFERLDYMVRLAGCGQ